jgi:hypothetical protein
MRESSLAVDAAVPVELIVCALRTSAHAGTPLPGSEMRRSRKASLANAKSLPLSRQSQTGCTLHLGLIGIGTGIRRDVVDLVTHPAGEHHGSPRTIVAEPPATRRFGDPVNAPSAVRGPPTRRFTFVEVPQVARQQVWIAVRSSLVKPIGFILSAQSDNPAVSTAPRCRSLQVLLDSERRPVNLAPSPSKQTRPAAGNATG